MSTKLATKMYSIVRLHLLTLLLFLWVCSADTQSSSVVYVATNGTNDTSCLTEGSSRPCKNLTFAIEHIHNSSSVTLYIKPGQYELLPSSEMTFNNGENITIEKDGEGVAEIVCREIGAGLTFIESKNIIIRGLVFNGCGSEHYSTSHDFNNETDGIKFLTFNATLYYQGCWMITLDSITVKNSLGIAVQIYYTLGINHIINSEFIDNPGDQEMEGGGGVYIEFPYCFPGNRLCNNTMPQVPVEYVSDSQYIITGCRFIRNMALSTTSSVRFVLPYKYYHIAFGHGGGLSVFFKGHAKNNYISLEGCNFLDNTAVYGGGMYIEMQDHSNNNTVVLMGVNVFKANTATRSGGGAFLAYLFTEQFGNVTSGTLTFNDVLFENNNATYGGGVSYLSTRQLFVSENNFNNVTFTDCVWSSNNARYGSALDASSFHPVSKGIIHEVIMTNCSFIDNSVVYTHSLGKPLGSGAMYVDEVPITFDKSVEFINNYDGTALFAMGSKLEFLSNTSVLFLNNTGRNGGAIALYGSSFIKVHENTSFEFIENTAINLGGAIYTEYIGSHLQKTSLNCFIRYFDITENPSKWSTLFQFTNNTANKKPNSIYATSINACLLGRAFGVLNKKWKKEVFCWNNVTDIWIYNSSVTYEACNDQILTDVASFRNGTILRNISIVPGRQQQMDIVAFDDQKKDVTSNLVLHAYGSHGAHVDERYNYISTDDIIISRTSSLDNVSITIDTMSENTIRTKIAVHFQDCPPGLELIQGKCNCTGDFNRRLLCDPSHLNASLLRGYWIGISPYNNTTIVVAHCRNCNYGEGGGHFSLGDDLQQVQKQLCGDNRDGVLCSNCSEGYAPAINFDNFDCVKCDSSVVGAFVFITLDIILPFMFLGLVYLFDVPLNSGLLHGPIFFCQMITTVITLDAENIIPYENTPGISKAAPGVIELIYTTIYDIFNLEFAMPWQKYCLSKNMRYATIIAIHYLSGYLPMVFVLVVAIVYYCRCCRCCGIPHGCRTFVNRLSESYLCKQIKKKKITNHANFLATSILLCYTKVALITVFLVSPVSLVSANDTSSSGRSNLVMYIDGSMKFPYTNYIVIALIFGMPFLLLVPLILFCCRSNNAKLNGGLCNHLLDQFQREFRNGPDDYDTIMHYDDQNGRLINGEVINNIPARLSSICPERRSDPDATCCDRHIDLCCNKHIDNQTRYEYRCCTATEIFSYKQQRSQLCILSCYTSWNCNDLRWFAGVLFFLRLVIVSIYMFAWNVIIQYMLQFTICLAAGMFVVISHPYKRKAIKEVEGSNDRVHKKLSIDRNIIEASSFFLLALMIAFSMYQYFYTNIGIPLSTWTYVMQIILLWIPLIWIIWAYIGLFLKRYQDTLCCRQRNAIRGQGEQGQNTYEINVQQREQGRNRNGSIVRQKKQGDKASLLNRKVDVELTDSSNSSFRRSNSTPKPNYNSTT